MTRMVALMRGINVGGNKRVPMADLRDVLASLGYTDVQTLLASGNAVFTCSPAAAKTAAADVEKGSRVRSASGARSSCVRRPRSGRSSTGTVA